MLWIGQGLIELPQTPIITLQILLVFRVNSFEFAVKRGGEEQGRYEELREAVKGAPERGGGMTVCHGLGNIAWGCGNLKKVIRLRSGGVSVGVARMCRQILVVLVLLRKLMPVNLGLPGTYGREVTF